MRPSASRLDSPDSRAILTQARDAAASSACFSTVSDPIGLAARESDRNHAEPTGGWCVVLLASRSRNAGAGREIDVEAAAGATISCASGHAPPERAAGTDPRIADLTGRTLGVAVTRHCAAAAAAGPARAGRSAYAAAAGGPARAATARCSRSRTSRSPVLLLAGIRSAGAGQDNDRQPELQSPDT
jgi:hypothetical protein